MGKTVKIKIIRQCRSPNPARIKPGKDKRRSPFLYIAYEELQPRTAGIIPITIKLRGIDIKPRKYDRNAVNHRLF